MGHIAVKRRKRRDNLGYHNLTTLSSCRSPVLLTLVFSVSYNDGVLTTEEVEARRGARFSRAERETAYVTYPFEPDLGNASVGNRHSLDLVIWAGPPFNLRWRPLFLGKCIFARVSEDLLRRPRNTKNLDLMSS